MSQVFVVFGKM